jgi:hypothetical protein
MASEPVAGAGIGAIVGGLIVGGFAIAGAALTAPVAAAVVLGVACKRRRDNVPVKWR